MSPLTTYAFGTPLVRKHLYVFLTWHNFCISLPVAFGPVCPYTYHVEIMGSPTKIDGAALTDAQRRICMLHLAGMSQDSIARFLDVTQKTVATTLSNPRVSRYLMQMQATYVDNIMPIVNDVETAFKDHALRASEVVTEIMESMHLSDNPQCKRVALSSAQDILDRAGYKPAQRVEQATVHAVHPDSLNKIAEVLRELSPNGDET